MTKHKKNHLQTLTQESKNRGVLHLPKASSWKEAILAAALTSPFQPNDRHWAHIKQEM